MVLKWITRRVKVGDLKPSGYNPRRMSDHDFESLKKSIGEYGHVYPMVCNSNLTVIGGHQTLRALKSLGVEETSVSVPERELTLLEEKALNLALNRISGEWDMNLLPDLLKELYESNVDMSLTGFDDKEINDLIQGLYDSELQEEARRKLSEIFIIPPFSVLDTRQGYWQKRKHAWLSIGIKSELGRGDAPCDGIAPDGKPTKLGAIPPKGLARCYGQDLMRGEHIVGGGIRVKMALDNDPMLRKVKYDSN